MLTKLPMNNENNITICWECFQLQVGNSLISSSLNRKRYFPPPTIDPEVGSQIFNNDDQDSGALFLFHPFVTDTFVNSWPGYLVAVAPVAIASTFSKKKQKRLLPESEKQVLSQNSSSYWWSLGGGCVS